jgi:hypothetical protein
MEQDRPVVQDVESRTAVPVPEKAVDAVGAFMDGRDPVGIVIRVSGG